MSQALYIAPTAHFNIWIFDEEIKFKNKKLNKGIKEGCKERGRSKGRRKRKTVRDRREGNERQKDGKIENVERKKK